MSVNAPTSPAIRAVQQFAQGLVPSAQKAYVALMMDLIARALVSASTIDGELKDEVAGYPAGFVIQMVVMPNGSGFYLQVQQDKSLVRLDSYAGKPDLAVKFKHLTHAFLVFSFQESTAQAFANDRMIADGEVNYAIRLVRCLNKLEALILPKLVADLAVKRYPSNLSLVEKLNKGSQIYLKVVANYAGSLPELLSLLSTLKTTSGLKKTNTGARHD